MSNVSNGVSVAFGISSTSFSGSGIGTFKLQSRNHSKKAKKEDVADATGATVQRTYYDPSEEATLEYIQFAANNAALTAALVTPAIGAIVTITDTSYTEIAGTNWMVDDVSSAGSNTSATKITLKLERFAGITAVTG